MSNLSFELPALGNITRDSDDLSRTAVFAAHIEALRVNVANSPIVQEQTELHAASDTGAQGLSKQLLHPIAVLGMDLVESVAADERFRFPKQRLITAAVEGALSFLVRNGDEIADIIG